jgi:hypothetical protein
MSECALLNTRPQRVWLAVDASRSIFTRRAVGHQYPRWEMRVLEFLPRALRGDTLVRGFS